MKKLIFIILIFITYLISTCWGQNSYEPCPKCGKGSIFEGIILDSYPEQYPYTCKSCNHYFTITRELSRWEKERFQKINKTFAPILSDPNITSKDNIIKFYPQPKPSPNKIIITLADLLEYEKECYADSIYNPPNGYWKFIKTDSTSYFGMVGGYEVYIGTEGFWEHREPTFKGFIEFIKRRLK